MKFIFSGILASLAFGSVGAEQLTTKDLYEKFNMRTVYSSYGQRLKYYCESYPNEFFSIEGASFVSDSRLELVSGEDVWVFTISEPNIISVGNQITSGTYNSVSTYELYFDHKAQDWKAKETYIEIPKDCEHYKSNS
ncbi:hypothetical protein [Vibrio campbellii]|uniref:Uncharacterized protein n=1 Tax=Vibrio campbellii TaxID=680 RepID=A0ACC7RH11_9VIBR